MRNRKRILYERAYRAKNKERLRNYRHEYEKKNAQRITVYREKYKEKWKKEHPIKHARGCRRRNLKRLFNLDLESYQKLLQNQNFSCAICGKSRKNNGKDFAVDHDHKTGKVRGLLCALCNCGIGYFRDNSILLKKAIGYLKNGQN